MKKILFLLLIMCTLGNISIAQKSQSGTAPRVLKRTCSTEMPSMEWEIDFQQKIQQYLANQQANRGPQANYTIPVVVHVVYWNASQNISQSQINGQIDILNADYAGTGLNANTIPTAFASLKANTNISFCMAQKNPNGITMTEPGIDRVNAQTKGFSNPDNTTGYGKTYIDNTIKPATIWDPTKYMNIWVLYITDGLLGYATFPTGTGLSGITGNGTATTDGVVIGHLYFGNTSSAPYNKGRTATHEVGHWLGLRHISGDSECGNDFCNDTPPQTGNAGDGQGLNYDCPTYPHQPNSCSGTGTNGELFMDFMDYTDDLCMYMFTNDQRTRMQTAMATGTYRAPLATSNVCTLTPTTPVANFVADKTAVCPGSSVKFTDQSSGSPTSWSWTFAGGTPATSTSQNPTVTYNTAGTYTVTLTATNTLGSDVETKTNYITVAAPTGTALPLVQTFESTTFPPTGWTLTSSSGFNWERTTTASGFGTSTASMKFNNSANNANKLKDDINSPTLSIGTVTNPRVKFDVAYAPYIDGVDDTYDTIEVLIKDICAGTTTSIYKKGGVQLQTATGLSSEFVPTATQWRKDSVNIPSTFANKYVQVIFRNYGLWGNTVYIDNINVYGTVVTGTPTASFTASDTTVCAGNNLTFTNTSTSGNATSIDSVRWTINGGIPSTSTSLTTVTATFNTAGTYTISLKAYEGGVGSTVFNKSIRVKALPTVASTTGAATVCVGATTTYSNTTAGGTWSSSATGIAIVNANGVVTGVSAGSAEIRYTVTSNGCSTTVTKIITVNALPTVASTTGAATVCVGATTTYSNTTAGGTWSSSATGIATVNANGVVTGVSAGTAEIRYTVTSNGCSTTVTKIITVNALPNVTAITGSTSICVGGTSTLSSTPAGGTWQSSNTAIATVNTNGVVSGVAIGSANIYYTVSSNGCTKSVGTTVTISNTAPTVIVTPNSTSVCNGDQVTLTANGAGNYIWSQTGTVVNNTLTFTPTANPTTVTVTGNVTGCSATGSATANISIKPKPPVGVSSPVICAGETAQPIANGATTYTWTGGLASIANPITPILNSNQTYTVTGTTNGCSNTAVSNVIVKPLPTTPIITQRNDTLTCSTIGGATYNWYRNGTLLTTTNTNILKITLSGSYTVEVIGTNSCKSVLSTAFNATVTGIRNNKIDIQYSIIPNPNNGLFEIRVTSTTNKNYQLKLFNVSGQTILSEEINIKSGLNSKMINIAGIEKGVYFISLIGEDGMSTQSIIVQ